MNTLTVEETMLYCPKCNATYEDGAQRFCLNDGRRLLPAPSSIKAAANSKGVFANILRSSPEDENNLNYPSAPPVFTPESLQEERNNFHTDFSSKVFKEDKKILSNSGKDQFLKPAIRLIKPGEVPSGTANVGDRKSNPTGRTALSWESPKALIGQTIKGRYYITEITGQDDSSITYLAEDKIIADKEMIVRVLMNEETDDFLNRIFAEERVALSHINHPNIASVIDSGELMEGNPFIVTEMVDGFSVKEKLEIMDRFEPARAAKIIRQASYALSELHQNGVLHRNLKPKNIFLTTTEAVKEQVKVTDFAVSSIVNKRNLETIKYFSPEQLEGRLPNYAGDIYSLGVIACEMLTGRHPFQFINAENLLKAQKKGLSFKVNDAEFNLPSVVNDVLEKALAYEPSERYTKARDFGDALYQAVISIKSETKSETESANSIPMPKRSLFPPKTDQLFVARESKPKNVDFSDLKTDFSEEEKSSNSIKTDSGDLTWERRSPDPLNQGSNSWLWIAGVGILVVLIGSWAIWHYALNGSAATENKVNSSAENSDQKTDAVGSNKVEANTARNSSPTPEEVESPPLPRVVTQPADTEYFQNTSLELKGDLARNYRGFTIYYPKSWQKNESRTNFLDISKKAESGTPIEQFLVSYYDSRGTFKLDGERFPKLVQDSSKKLSQIVSNYRLVSEGEKTINNGWKGYEMKFEGAGVTASGEKINLWGKRLFIPVARPGTKSGFVITMLATSLSPDIKSADDVGINGELAKILETFEPSTLD